MTRLVAALALALAMTAAALGAEQAPAPLSLEQALRPGDRLLFVGDELTQQMFYPRAVAAALLSLRPDDDLRFFNGGYDGATAASAASWLDDLLEISRPTVVFVCLGLNDGQGKPLAEAEPLAAAFRADLEALVDRLRAYEGVRLVVLMTPPPLQAGLTDPILPQDYNATLLLLATVVREVAAAKGAGYIDLFNPMRAAYLAQAQAGGEPLTVGGRLPTEAGHVVLASAVLKGLGVSRAQLESVGWSPLTPRRMGRIRPVLAVPAKAPSMAAAQRSQELYESIQRFDEAFFRLWRLSGRQPSAPPRPALQATAEEAWSQVRAAGAGYRREAR